MLWGAGALQQRLRPVQEPALRRELRAPTGAPQRLQTFPPPTPEETRTKGVLPTSIRCRGGRSRSRATSCASSSAAASSVRDRQSRRASKSRAADAKLSDRGLRHALNRTDPVFLGLQKTRLLDPTAQLPGHQRPPRRLPRQRLHACHVVYANDRSPAHSGALRDSSATGPLATADRRSIPKDEPGHPIKHAFTRVDPDEPVHDVPHAPGHQHGDDLLGYTWWDNETDGDKMYPPRSEDRTRRRAGRDPRAQPRGAALRASGSDVGFLATGRPSSTRSCSRRSSPTSTATAGSSAPSSSATCSTRATSSIARPATVDRRTTIRRSSARPVHLKDIHLEKGMQCVDCHFEQDNHGNGKLYGETRNAVEIDCVDCHGTRSKAARRAHERPGLGAPRGGTPLAALRTPFGKRASTGTATRCSSGRWWKNLKWEVPQVVDAITPGQPATTRRRGSPRRSSGDGKTWGTRRRRSTRSRTRTRT